MNQELRSALRSFGAGDAGAAGVADGPSHLPVAISVAVRLSDAIIDEIDREPTYTYFNHYRSVNYLIDQILLRTGLWLEERGARYVTVAASQSRPDSPFEARYSHKKAACLSGLGDMGRNNLFLHRSWGPRVRLGTLFTDWQPALEGGGADSCRSPAVADISARGISDRSLSASCGACALCADACPASAFEGGTFDPARCSAWMKKSFRHIGRGVVCGICMRVCPGNREG